MQDRTLTLIQDDGREILAVCDRIAEFRVFDGSAVLLAQRIHAVEALVLGVGRENASDKGEHEHEDQDDQADHGDAVAEEPLGDHGARGQNFNASVVV